MPTIRFFPTCAFQHEPVHVIPSNPTAENIAKLIFDYTHEQGFPVVEVVLWETHHSFATYCPSRGSFSP